MRRSRFSTPEIVGGVVALVGIGVLIYAVTRKQPEKPKEEGGGGGGFNPLDLLFPGAGGIKL